MEPIHCIGCNCKIEVPDDILKGEILDCIDCGLEFEIITVNGNIVQFKEAEFEGEDWGE